MKRKRKITEGSNLVATVAERVEEAHPNRDPVLRSTLYLLFWLDFIDRETSSLQSAFNAGYGPSPEVQADRERVRSLGIVIEFIEMLVERARSEDPPSEHDLIHDLVDFHKVLSGRQPPPQPTLTLAADLLATWPVVRAMAILDDSYQEGRVSADDAYELILEAAAIVLLEGIGDSGIRLWDKLCEATLQDMARKQGGGGAIAVELLTDLWETLSEQPLGVAATYKPRGRIGYVWGVANQQARQRLFKPEAAVSQELLGKDLESQRTSLDVEVRELENWVCGEIDSRRKMNREGAEYVPNTPPEPLFPEMTKGAVHLSRTTLWRRLAAGVNILDYAELLNAETTAALAQRHHEEGRYTLRQAASKLGVALSSLQKGIKKAEAAGVELFPQEGKYYRLTDEDLEKICPFLPTRRRL